MTDYELLDFGNGRKLERFGDWVLDRVSPPAVGASRALPLDVWSKVDARFLRTQGLKGQWQCRRELPEAWGISWGDFSLELKRTDVGHLGVFPEQAENWRWIFQQAQAWLQTGRPLRVLNLFAYTGGSTLAAASAMFQAGKTSEDRERFSVAHVDSAKNVVQWARRNAEISGLTDAPIRWIAEDARLFVQRELKRGRAYEAVILDPPSYGHGTKGEMWKLDAHLPELLDQCGQLLADEAAFVLLTLHSPGTTPKMLGQMLRRYFPQLNQNSVLPMELKTSQGRTLQSGMAARAWG